MLFADAAELDHQDGCVGRDFESGHVCDLRRRLADALRIHRPGGSEQQLAQRFFLRLGAEVSLCGFELGDDALAQGLFGHHGLLARANRTEVESFSIHDFTDGIRHVGRALDHHGDVARSHAESRLAARIGRFDDGVAAGGENHTGAVMPHQGIGGFDRRSGDALDDVGGGAGFDSRLIEYVRRFAGAPPGVGVRAEHDRVSGFQRDQGFVDCGGRRIGGG